MKHYQEIIDKYYASGSPLREILMLHSEQVARKAVDIARAKKLPLDLDQVITAAMLHDIGIIYANAPGIHCHGEHPYIAHGVLGAKLLRSEGMPEWAARVAERHTGAGITAEDVVREGLPLPVADYMPETLLEQLVCYADKFYSKSGDMQEKSLERVRQSMSKFGGATLERFEELHKMFS